MSETPPSQSRSSLLYAIGLLTGETAAHKEAIDRLRNSQEDMPQKVAAYLSPQLTAMNETLADHGRRIPRIEKQVWLFSGGLAVIVTLLQVWPAVSGRGGP